MKDLNSTVLADTGLAKAFHRAAGEAGVPCKKGKALPMGGGMDSAAFTQDGFHFVGISGLNYRLEDYAFT